MIIENQIRLIQTMVSYIMCALGWGEDDINPLSRARNSRLGESQGWLVDHSHFFFDSCPLSLSLSLSSEISNNPGKFLRFPIFAPHFPKLIYPPHIDV